MAVHGVCAPNFSPMSTDHRHGHKEVRFSPFATSSLLPLLPRPQHVLRGGSESLAASAVRTVDRHRRRKQTVGRRFCPPFFRCLLWLLAWGDETRKEKTGEETRQTKGGRAGDSLGGRVSAPRSTKATPWYAKRQPLPSQKTPPAPWSVPLHPGPFGGLAFFPFSERFSAHISTVFVFFLFFPTA
nr:hypothetical protein [Pandoravirus aubagnensis]